MGLEWKKIGIIAFWVLIIHIVVALCLALPLHFGRTVIFQASDPHVGYYSGLGDRTTLNIIWSCFSTIFICVYTAVHLDVDQFVHGGLHSLRGKVGFLLLGIAAPEGLQIIAAGEYFQAAAVTRRMQDRRDVTSHISTNHNDSSEGIPLHSVHNMESTTNSVDDQESLEHRHSTEQQWTMTHSFFLGMKGFQDQDRSIIATEQLVSFSTKHTLEYGIISTRLDDIRDQINAMSKADALVKALACIQIIWFLINIFARLASKLPISPLEWTTCGYIGCTLGTYAFWWHKPYNVSRRITLPVHVLPSSNSDSDIDYSKMGSLLSAVVGTIVFGGCHLAAWNHDFVNSSGKPLWRICAIIITVFLMPAVVAAAVVDGSISQSRFKALRNILFASLVSVYYIARLLLIYLLFVSFWSLPAGVYQDTRWSSFFPSIR